MQPLVDVSCEPVLNGHVPGTHAFTQGWRQLTAVQVKIMNRVETVRGIIITMATIHTISSRGTIQHLFLTRVADSTNTAASQRVPNYT